MGVTAATLAVIGLASAGIQAYGEYQEGQERARAEEFNADIARKQAELFKVRARLDIIKQKKEATAFRGTQEALYSKAGVVFTGSPLAVIQESAANAELDILTTEFNALMESTRSEVEAREIDRRARAERKIGYTRAGRTLLTAALTYGGEFSSEGTVPKKKIGE